MGLHVFGVVTIRKTDEKPVNTIIVTVALYFVRLEIIMPEGLLDV